MSDGDDYGDWQSPGGGYGGSQQPGTLYASREPKAKPAKPPAKAAPTRPAAHEVRLHLYLPMPQTRQEFVNYLDYSWDQTGLGPFSAMGVTLTLITDEKKGIEDL